MLSSLPHRPLVILLSSAAFVSAPVQAQEARDADAPQDHVHVDQGQEIVVTAPGLRDLSILAGTSVLSGADLVREMRPQLGETLTRLPGVSATSFGPGASRPVLRGFQGDRVRVLVDGIGSIDASGTSTDHAVTIDPITADRIEVLNGPAVLLFGSQAIGGAVNVFDKRIPRTVPDDRFFHIDTLAGFGSAADEKSFATGVDVSLGGGWVAHVDGSVRETDDLEVGGFVLARSLRNELLALADEEEAEGHLEEAAEARQRAGQRDVLPNSATRTWTAGAGLALIRDTFNIGASLSAFDTRYGVPTRPGAHHHEDHDEETGEEEAHAHGDVPISIDLRQYRADLRAEVEAGGFVEKVQLRAAAADYEHVEYEGDEVGTRFETKGVEGRIEAIQANRGGWRGVTGGQFFVRDQQAFGAEAFVPPNETRQFGLFTLQELERGAFEFEGAMRYEHSQVSALGIERSFDTVSLAAGGSVEVAPRVRFGLNLSRSERAPSAEELFSSGPHVATQAFEQGDPALDTERTLGGELYARAMISGFRLDATVFANRFDGYIYQAATGAEQDGLPVFRYFQSDADHWGFEIGAEAPLGYLGPWRFSADAVADYVRLDIEEAGPAPRIPPLRLLGGIEARSTSFDGRIEVEKIFDQERVAAFETPTDGFTLVNASLTWRPWGADNPSSLTLSANNLFDVDARRHASVTKDFVPLAGRDIRLGARFSF